MKTTLPPVLLRLLGAAFLATASAACSGVSGTAPATPAAAPAVSPAASANAPAASPAAPAGLLAQLQAEIGNAACSANSDCKTVAVGHKACGGPESYLPYSAKTGDAASIARLAAAYSAERKSQNAKSGMMSTCSVVLDPGALCQAGRCVSGGGTNLAR